jgi:RNA polymerase sigma-70 factor (ECF subfamily)
VQTVSDVALVARARRGDSSAFAELVSRYHAFLIHTARTIVRSPEDAEDVTQRAWIQAYQHLGHFVGTSSVRTWLVAITRNAAIDQWRLARRQRQSREDSAIGFRAQAISKLPSPEGLLLEKERQAHLTHAIAALPVRLRAPLRLWRSERHSYAEMATKAGVAVGTIKSRIWEARQQVVVSCRARMHVSIEMSQTP